ncbi:tail sheath protein [Pararheinheimera phage vB_PsoM_KLER1-1]|nr:tail sheath protein [Pararheinheimera phage vB_PsoM_KLER1-1]
MAYQHGVTTQERPTSIIPPVRTFAGLPVVVGTAPVVLAADGVGKVNEPVLAYTYAEAVAALGYSAEYDKFTLCEAMDVFFKYFNVGPVVFINVLDPAVAGNKTAITAEAKTLNSDGEAVTTNAYVVRDSVVVKNTGGTVTYVKDTDYTLTFQSGGKAVITRITGGAILAGAQLTLDYSYLNGTGVDSADIIGGVDGAGKTTGLELIEEIFPRLRLVPTQILAPKFSTDPTVYAVMVAKTTINGIFKAIALADVPTDTVDLYTEVPAWINTNNYKDENSIVCWPKVALGDLQFHMSLQIAALNMQVDAANGDIPFNSPSNNSLQANSAVLSSGAEVWLNLQQANFLNGEGIVTALNFVGGWKAWGNRTAVYPSVTDVKDTFIPVRRMFNWYSNELILTYWQKVDKPTNRRLIDTVVDSNNIRLNGLAAPSVGALIGQNNRVEFLEDENPLTDLIDGKVRFHVYMTPATPAEQIDFVLEYDVSNLASLFG